MIEEKQRNWLDLIVEATERRVVRKEVKDYSCGSYRKKKDGRKEYYIQHKTQINLTRKDFNDLGFGGLRSYQDVVVVDEENFLELIRFLLNAGHLEDIVDDDDMEYLKGKLGLECKSYGEAIRELEEKEKEILGK